MQQLPPDPTPACPGMQQLPPDPTPACPACLPVSPAPPLPALQASPSATRTTRSAGRTTGSGWRSSPLAILDSPGSACRRAPWRWCSKCWTETAAGENRQAAGQGASPLLDLWFIATPGSVLSLQLDALPPPPPFTLLCLLPPGFPCAAASLRVQRCRTSGCCRCPSATQHQPQSSQQAFPASLGTPCLQHQVLWQRLLRLETRTR
jgi:hypothetical protein